jgi:hypothetical protein
MRLRFIVIAVSVASLSLAFADARQQDKPVQPGPGLIGRTLLDGKDVGMVFRYEHGKVFRHELVERKFAEKFDKGLPHRGLEIVLRGRLHVPKEMTVHARHAGGSVSYGIQSLWIGGLEIGSVGDNTQKSQIYKLKLEAGTHRVKWVLRGGQFGNNLLRFEDPVTGKPLSLTFSAEDVKDAGQFSAKDAAVANSEERGWPIPLDW